MTWDGVVRLPGRTLEALAARHGGRVAAGGAQRAGAHRARSSGPRRETSRRCSRVASSRPPREAGARGAALLSSTLECARRRARVPVLGGSARLGARRTRRGRWPSVLDDALVPETRRRSSAMGASIAPSAVLGPRVVIGARVTIGAGRRHRPPGLRLGVRLEAAPCGAVPAARRASSSRTTSSIGPLSHGRRGHARRRRASGAARSSTRTCTSGHNGDIGEGDDRRRAVRLRRLGDDRPRRARRRPGRASPITSSSATARASPPRAASSATYPREPPWQDTRRCRARDGCARWRRCTGRAERPSPGGRAAAGVPHSARVARCAARG